MRLASRLCTTVITGLAALLLTGCSAFSPSPDLPDEKDKVEVYTVSNTKVAPEPVYNRLRWVHLPQPLPEQRGAIPTESMILPIVHLALKDASLQEAADLLTSTTSYRSYCESSIAKQKITIEALGTVDELVKLISKKSGITAEIDHETRSIRFLK